jgi:hypothetical protein
VATNRVPVDKPVFEAPCQAMAPMLVGWVRSNLAEAA